MITRRYLVQGRVQGVGFRWFVEREARLIGMAGWVRNTDGGQVEVLAQGTGEQHGALRQKLEEGPRAARVESVECSERPEAAKLEEFEIEGAW